MSEIPETEPPASGTPAAPANENMASPEPDMKAVVSALQDEIAERERKLAELKDQVLRAHAEMDNVRKRAEREKLDNLKYAIAKFARDVVSVSDNFERAIAAVPEGAADSDPALKSLIEGVRVTEREFLNMLERNGVKRLEPKGEPFNPHLHQAVMETENKSVPHGTILTVMQSGYMLEERVLRPAIVVVARGGAKLAKPAPAAAGEAAPDASGGTGSETPGSGQAPGADGSPGNGTSA